MKKIKILLTLLLILGICSIAIGIYRLNLANENTSKIDSNEDVNRKPDENGKEVTEEILEEEEITSKETTTKENIASTYELKKLGDLEYYLYTPSNPESGMALVMYLHGGTNKKEDVTKLLTTDGFAKYLYDGYYNDLRSYVVIPKLGSNYKSWTDISDTLRNLIKSLSKAYDIDTNKISLTGHSMGGTGTYQMAIKLPNIFACIAPMSGSVSITNENLEALSKTKVWAFVGSSDTIVDPSFSRKVIEALKNMGKYAKLTGFDGAGHFDVPSLGYKDSDVLNWLINCSK